MTANGETAGGDLCTEFPLAGLDGATGSVLTAHLVNVLRSRDATARFIWVDHYPSGGKDEHILVRAQGLEVAFKQATHDERVRGAVRYLALIDPVK